MSSMTELKTARLLLKHLGDRDKFRLVELLSVYEVAQNLTRVPHPYTLSDAEEWLARVEENPFNLSIFLNDKLIGVCLLVIAETVLMSWVIGLALTIGGRGSQLKQRVDYLTLRTCKYGRSWWLLTYTKKTWFRPKSCANSDLPPRVRTRYSVCLDKHKCLLLPTGMRPKATADIRHQKGALAPLTACPVWVKCRSSWARASQRMLSGPL